MRLFIDQYGKTETLVCDHAIHCSRIIHTTLFKHLQTNVRIATHGETFAAETRQKKLTDDQIKTIRREFRQSRCFEFIGSVDGKLLRNIKEIKK